MKVVYALVFFLAVAYAGPPLLGAWTELSPDHSNYNRAVLLAYMRVNEMSNDAYHKKVVEVLSVKQKVVAGMLYEVRMRMGLTQCLKTEVSLAQVGNCDVNPESANEICTVELLDSPFLIRGAPSVKVTKAVCGVV